MFRVDPSARCRRPEILGNCPNGFPPNTFFIKNRRRRGVVWVPYPPPAGDPCSTFGTPLTFVMGSTPGPRRGSIRGGMGYTAGRKVKQIEDPRCRRIVENGENGSKIEHFSITLTWEDFHSTNISVPILP